MAALVAAPLAAVPIPALAVGFDDFTFQGSASVLVETDRERRDTPFGTTTRALVYTEMLLNARLALPAYGYTLDARVKLAQARDPGDTFVFDTESLYVDRLTLTVDEGPLRVVFGKFVPRFGIAHTWTPGLFGTDAPGPYEMPERIGAGLWWTFPKASWGKARAAFQAFALDITPLSNAAFNRPPANVPTTKRPGRLTYEDGGIGNTGTPENFILSLGVDDVAGIKDLSLLVSAGRQGEGLDGGGQEHRAAASLLWKDAIAPGVIARAIGDVARVWRPDLATSQTWVTGGGGVQWNGWALSGALTSITYTTPDVAWSDTTLSVGLDRQLFEFAGGNFVASAGAKRDWLAGDVRDTVGAALVWTTRWNDRARAAPDLLPGRKSGGG